MDQVYDVLIVGGGSAATSAAMTLRNRGKSIAVVTNKPETSSLYKAEKITNYPGLPPMTGAEITALFRKQLEDTGATIIEGRTISVLPMDDSFGVAVGSDYYMARSIIITAGITREKLYPGEAEFLGRGVSYCATCDGMLYRGKRAAVIGLAADAPAEADFLREIGCDVHYYDGKKHRFEIRGAERADTLVVDGAAEPADVIFVLRAGFAADTLLPGLATEKGHIVVDEAFAASIPGVFAAGDCTGAPYQIPAAVGEGNCAALSVVRWLRNA